MKKQEIEPPKTRNVIVTSILIIGGLFILSLFLTTIIGIALLIGEPTEEGNVAIIEIKGMITGDGNGFNEGASATTIISLLEKANNNPLVEAIVLDINSPGGSPVASAEIANAIKESNKPTIAWIRDSGTSGAYWIASATNHSIAHELSITGSIGVYGSYLEFSNFLTEHNITYQRMVSGKYKDLGSPLKNMNEYEEYLLQEKLDLMHDYFIKAVAENRNMSYDEITPYADGMFLLGVEAKEAGLIDELGGKEEITAYLAAQNITADYYYLKRNPTFANILTSFVSEHGFSVGEGFATELQQESFNVRT